MAPALSTSTAYSPAPPPVLTAITGWPSIPFSPPPPGTSRFHIVQPGHISPSPGTTVPAEPSFQSAGTVGIAVFDPLVDHITKLIARRVKDRLIRSQLDERLRELEIDAQLNDEPLSQASIADLRRFLTTLTLTHRPAIFLLDNGNFRAVWKNTANEQVALQFLGGGVVQYVIFVQRPNPPMLATHAGREALSSIRSQITATSCDHLLFG